MKCIATFLMVLTVTYSAVGGTYYISSTGSDTENAGTSQADPWAIIGKVNANVFSPDDSVLFEGGATFEGGLAFNSTVLGTAAYPIVISPNGAGKSSLKRNIATL